jgi:hypothetical protein
MNLTFSEKDYAEFLHSKKHISAFGEIIFIPKDKTVPSLPDMRLLFFYEAGAFQWRAVCIDLEIDACGLSMDHAWKNLQRALLTYIAAEKEASDNSLACAARNIIEEAFNENEQKRQYINIYRQVLKDYTMREIESGNIHDPIEEGEKRLETLKSSGESIQSIIIELPAA